MTAAAPIDLRPRGKLWAALVLVALTAAVYSPVLGHHFIEAWDDTSAILTNPDYNPPTFAKLAHYWVIPPRHTFYVPVTYTLWGLLAMAGRSSAPPGVPFNPAVFYAANLASHAFASGLVFLILSEVIAQSRPAAGTRVPLQLAAWLGAAVFAVHPIQVEGVATASSVYSPLSGLFGFFAIWQYLLASDRSDSSNLGRFGWGRYMLATAGFLLAILTKPTAVAVPLVVAVIEWTLRKGKPIRLATTLGAWIVLALAVILINEQSSPGGTVFVPDPPLRFLVPLDAINFYLMKFFFPLRLVSDYGRSPRWFVNHPLAWLDCLVPLLILAIAWRMRHRTPWLLMSFGVFIAGLLPSIGIVPFDFQHYSTVADRYAYIAMLGPAMAVMFFIVRLGRIAAGVTVAAIAVLATLSIIQLSYWRDDWRLMTRSLEVNPNSLAAETGFRYLLTDFQHRGFPAPQNCTIDQSSLVHVGDLLMQRRQWLIASAAYQRALALGAPSAAIYDRLGRAFLRDLDPERARQAFTQALQVNPHDADARRGLEQAAALRGN